MAVQKVLKVEKFDTILGSTQTVDGVLKVGSYLATHLDGVEGIANIPSNKSIASSDRGQIAPVHRQAKSIYTMNFDKWVSLVKWALVNSSLTEAKEVLAMTLGVNLVKSTAISSNKFFDLQISPKIGSVLTETFASTKFVGTGANSVSLDFGADMGSKTVTVEVLNTNFTSHASANVVLDTNGIGTASLTLSGFVNGYFNIKAGTIFSQTSYSSVLNSDVRIEDFLNIKYDAVYKVGA